MDHGGELERQQDVNETHKTEMTPAGPDDNLRDGQENDKEVAREAESEKADVTGQFSRGVLTPEKGKEKEQRKDGDKAESDGWRVKDKAMHRGDGDDSLDEGTLLCNIARDQDRILHESADKTVEGSRELESQAELAKRLAALKAKEASSGKASSGNPDRKKAAGDAGSGSGSREDTPGGCLLLSFC